MSWGSRRIPKHLIINDAAPPKKSFGIAWLLLALAVLVISMLVSIRASADGFCVENRINKRAASCLQIRRLQGEKENSHKSKDFARAPRDVELNAKTLAHNFVVPIRLATEKQQLFYF